MDFSLTETQQQYVETVQRFVKVEIIPSILAREKAHAFPWDIITKAWEMGIMNLSLPEHVKGYAIDAVSSALIIRELAYGDSGIATSAMCNDLANVVIALHGTEGQQERFLKPFVATPLLASFCLTEPGAGSDNAAMTSFLKKTGNGTYVLNGAKIFITNASYASQFTVFCRVGSPTGAFMACVVVPVDDLCPREEGTDPARGRSIELEGGGTIITGKAEEKLGQRLSNTAAVTFENVEVTEEQIIGERRRGFQYLVDVLDYARPMVAAIGVGLARRALSLTLAYTRERRQFGSRICDLPVARDTLVKMWKKVELADLALMEAAWMADAKHPRRGLYASLAKNVAAEAALFCANEGLHLHGGYGFMEEYEIAKLARDAHIIDIYEGVREVQDMIIGREIV
ncbi:MAG: acyl-CoA dehydrogenase family protein [Syntrophales bacterium]|nr:acyl-CoA dehydrogenase family protein [Syntrophales bacterium]